MKDIEGKTHSMQLYHNWTMDEYIVLLMGNEPTEENTEESKSRIGYPILRKLIQDSVERGEVKFRGLEVKRNKLSETGYAKGLSKEDKRMLDIHVINIIGFDPPYRDIDTYWTVCWDFSLYMPDMAKRIKEMRKEGKNPFTHTLEEMEAGKIRVVNKFFSGISFCEDMENELEDGSLEDNIGGGMEETRDNVKEIRDMMEKHHADAIRSLLGHKTG